MVITLERFPEKAWRSLDRIGRWERRDPGPLAGSDSTCREVTSVSLPRMNLDRPRAPLAKRLGRQPAKRAYAVRHPRQFAGQSVAGLARGSSHQSTTRVESPRRPGPPVRCLARAAALSLAAAGLRPGWLSSRMHVRCSMHPDRDATCAQCLVVWSANDEDSAVPVSLWSGCFFSGYQAKIRRKTISSSCQADHLILEEYPNICPKCLFSI
jgi:hypothetical protein